MKKTFTLREQSFQDRDGNLRNIDSREDPSLPGTAYGFAYCSAPEAVLVPHLGVCKDSVRTDQSPSKLALIVSEGIDPDVFVRDKGLQHIASQARESGANYVIIAQSDKSNHETAVELGNIMLQSHYIRPERYTGEGRTAPRIVYKQDRQYFDIE